MQIKRPAVEVTGINLPPARLMLLSLLLLLLLFAAVVLTVLLLQSCDAAVNEG